MTEEGRPYSRARSRLRTVYQWSTAFGLDPRKFWYGIAGLPGFTRDYFRFRRQLAPMRTEWPLQVSAPCLDDKWRPSGETRGHYFLQDLHVAQRIFQRNPRRHVDVGSRVDGFVAHVASFREITVIDVRSPPRGVKNVEFLEQDINELPESLCGIADSVSCLHALEHFGLGRYGDPLGAGAYTKGLQSLGQLLVPGGMLYLSVPIGCQRIEFNGHRIFAVRTILDLAGASGFGIRAFSYIDDAGEMHECPPAVETAAGVDRHLNYGCGIFEFCKLATPDGPKPG